MQASTLLIALTFLAILQRARAWQSNACCDSSNHHYSRLFLQSLGTDSVGVLREYDLPHLYALDLA
jgi:hypothetical protein